MQYLLIRLLTLVILGASFTGDAFAQEESELEPALEIVVREEPAAEKAPSGIIRQLEEARAYAKQVSSENLSLKDPSAGVSPVEGFSPLKTKKDFEWWEYPFRPFYPASELKITGNYYISKVRVLNLLRPYMAEDLAFIKTSAAKAVLEREPWVDSVSVSRGFYTGLVQVEITEERPWLVVELSDTNWLLSKKRRFIAPLENIKDADFQIELSQLPRYLRVVDNGEIDTERLETGLSVIEKIDAASNFSLDVDFYEYDKELGLKVIPREFKKARAKEILFSNDSFLEIEKRLEQFSLVQEDLKNRGEIVNRADLRFSKQIIVE